MTYHPAMIIGELFAYFLMSYGAYWVLKKVITKLLGGFSKRSKIICIVSVVSFFLFVEVYRVLMLT